MTTTTDLLATIWPLAITAATPGRSPNVKDLHQVLRDTLYSDPSRAPQLCERMEASILAWYPSMPQRVAVDCALAHVRLSLTRTDLGPVPGAAVAQRYRAAPPAAVRPKSRAERKQEMLAKVQPIRDADLAERARRYREFAESRSGSPIGNGGSYIKLSR